MRWIAVVIWGASALGPAVLGAQEPGGLSGWVVDGAGAGVSGADVFLLETLEGATTGREGEFALRSAHRGRATVVVRGLGYEEARVPVELPRGGPLVVEVVVVGVALEPIRVAAGVYRMGVGESEPLTPLDVVRTPGAHADVLQAVGVLPGVQPLEEGAALYVRGGDVSETKVLLDGAELPAPYRFESGLVSFGTLDPFDLEGVSFSSGGFGARHGGALSGLLELESAGVPVRRDVSATVSLGALSGRLRIPFGERAGVAATANRSSTGLMHRLNGHDTDFLRVPEARNLAARAAWEYRRGGVVKLFAYDEWNRYSVRVDAPSYAGAFTGEDGSGLAVVSVVDVAGPVGVSGSLAVSRRSQRQEFGAFLLDEGDRLFHGRGELSGLVAPGLVVRAGADADVRRSSLAGSYPETGSDVRPGARATRFDARREARRWAVFGELEWRAAERLELTGGARRDAGSLPGSATWDPRLAAALQLAEGVILTGAWGVYHQVAAPLAYAPEVGEPTLPPMASQNAVAGLVVERGTALLRVEAYRKVQRELAQVRRDRRVAGGGRGSSRGVDVFLRGRIPLGLEGRVSYSFIDAERTDPDTGAEARSPYEIRHALAVVVERDLGERLRLGTTYRHATGRPYTPVIAAEYSEADAVWVPEYGAAMSERLPAYGRVDLSAQFLHSFGGDDLVAFFLSVTNVLDRRNVAGLRHNADYSAAEPVRSAFRRIFYFGVMATLPF